MCSILNKEKILEQARIFIDEGRYDKAIKEYEKILMADPSDMRVKLRIAELYIKRKQVSEAIRVYREVAQVYSNEGFYLKAVTVYKNILRLNPSIMEINELLADLYVKMGLVNDAVRQYDIYASALESKGDFEKLIEVRKKVVELIPDNGGARVRLAELYQREGHSEEALDQYEEYARRLEASGSDQSRLVEMYEKILSHRTGREDMLRDLVRIYYRSGEIKKALKWLEFAKTLTPIDTELLGMQADIYVRLNQIETARSKYLALADLHREKGSTDEAARALALIALHIPSEEERVEKRAADIGPAALRIFKQHLEQLREDETEKARKADLEDESERDEHEAPTAQQEQEKEAVAPPADEKQKGTASEPQPDQDFDRTVMVPMDQLLKKKPQEQPQQHAAKKAKPHPAAKRKTKPAKPLSDGERLKQAKAAYDLGLLYKKLGLTDESRHELEKAAHLYEELEEKTPTALARLSELRVMIGVTSKRTSPRPKRKHDAEETVKPQPRATAAKRRARSEAKRSERKKTRDKKEAKKKKRKVSFV